MLSLFTEMFSHNQTAGAPNEMPKCTNQTYTYTHTNVEQNDKIPSSKKTKATETKNDETKKEELSEQRTETNIYI